MTKFEEAVKIIANEYKEDCEELDCSIRELFKCWQYDNKDMKNDFVDILYNANFNDFTEDGEILGEGNKVYTLRQLAKAVRDYQF